MLWAQAKGGRTVVYAVAVNCLKNPTPNPNPHPKPNPVRNPTTNPIPNPNLNPTNPIPYSSGNYCYGVNYTWPAKGFYQSINQSMLLFQATRPICPHLKYQT